MRGWAFGPVLCDAWLTLDYVASNTSVMNLLIISIGKVERKIILFLSVTVMLVTSLCWWLYDGDWFQMLVAESLCWRLFSLCWRFSQCIKSVTNILNRSPISQTCHQHILPQTSVTNIDVTSKIECKREVIAWEWSELLLVLSFTEINLKNSASEYHRYFKCRANE